MVRRVIAVGAGLLVLVGLALLPATAGAQTPNDEPYPPEFTVPPTVLPSSTVPPARPTTTTRPRPQDTRPPAVQPGEATPPPPGPQAEPQRPGPQVQGDVVSRPLPRTGSDLNGTAVAGAALTMLGIALALGARKRRNAFEG